MCYCQAYFSCHFNGYLIYTIPKLFLYLNTMTCSVGSNLATYKVYDVCEHTNWKFILYEKIR